MVKLSQVAGENLLINVLDHRADQTPDKPFASLPRSSKPQDGFYDITYGAVRRAVDWTAHFLDDNFRIGNDARTVAWAGPPSDFRYILLAFAAMKTGHRIYFPSLRNSIEANLSLLQECNCDAFLLPESSPMPMFDTVLKMSSMHVETVPSFEEILSRTEIVQAAFQHDYSFENARYKPCMVLHTSGSTGIPKPIIIKQGWFSVIDACHDLAKVGAQPFALTPFAGLRAFMPFPNFHAGALCIKLCFSVFFDSPMISPPSVPLTSDLVVECLKHADVQAAFLPPSILREMTLDGLGLDSLASLQVVGNGGAALADDVFTTITARTHIVNCFGITESNGLPIELTTKEDAQYFRFGPNTGLRFDPVADNQYELVIVRDSRLDLMQGIFVTFPELTEWHTKDIWSKHPEKPEHWYYEGRTDDVIVFRTGEKHNPLSMEHVVESHPDVGAALVAGTGQIQASLLLEPRHHPNNNEERQAFIEKVWPTVEEANRETVAHGRVDRAFIMLARPEKSFLRAGKGSVQRKLTLQLYAPEIDSLYQSIETNGASTEEHQSTDLNFSTFERTKASLRHVLQDVHLPVSSDDEDFFARGMDSLQVVTLARRIRSATGNSDFQNKTIYTEPSVNKLARVLSNADEARTVLTREQHMRRLLTSVCQNFPLNARPALTPPPGSKATVLLTGSTGSLGSYLLDRLLANPAVKHVICLNRSSAAATRQQESHRLRDLTCDLDRVEFAHADPRKGEHLGLVLSQYLDLLHSVTHVLHNAWPVNFNQSLSSFEPSVRYVRQIVDFSAHSIYGAHIYFLSSIGVTQQYKSDVVPEETIHDLSTSHPLGMGYPESKHVSEMLLEQASKVGVEASVCRIGQIAGPVDHGLHGEWSKQEWLPSLIASSMHLGVISKTLGPFQDCDWIPVDRLANVVVELLLAAKAPGRVNVHHAVNPTATSWSELLPAVLSSIAEERRPKVVAFADWVSALERSAEYLHVQTAGDWDDNPALKLLDSFVYLRNLSVSGHKLPRLDLAKTSELSSSLKECRPVSEEWMRLWMRQWKFGECVEY